MHKAVDCQRLVQIPLPRQTDRVGPVELGIASVFDQIRDHVGNGRIDAVAQYHQSGLSIEHDRPVLHPSPPSTPSG